MKLRRIACIASLCSTFALSACAEGDPTSRDEIDDPEALAQEAVAAGGQIPGATVEQVKINGLTFDVRVAGPRTGEPVILLHGFPESSYEWRKQIPVLAAAGYRVIAPDLRGYSPGARPSDVKAYGLLNLVDDLIKLSEYYKVPRFHVVGHDVGGLVAWGAAQIYDKRIRSVTALSVPHPGAFAQQLNNSRSCQSKASAWYNDAVKEGSAARFLAGDPPLLLDVWKSREPDAEAEYRRLLGTAEGLDAAFNMWRANFVDGKPQGALPIPVTMPTMYVWGDQDPFNCGDGERLTRLLSWGGYRYELLRGVGHWIPEEAAERFNTVLLAHLRKNRI